MSYQVGDIVILENLEGGEIVGIFREEAELYYLVKTNSGSERFCTTRSFNPTKASQVLFGKSRSKWQVTFKYKRR